MVAGTGASVFVVVAGSELLLSLEVEEAEELPLSDGAEPRLSVLYQPLPLNTIAGGRSSRRASPLQLGQGWTAGALKLSRFSYSLPQALQR